MRKIITKFKKDERNLQNQLFFQIQLIYAQMLEGQMNTEQGGDNVAQWIAWTEMSLNEIDMYNY